MIEIIDKINNTVEKIPDNTEAIIDPIGNPIIIKDNEIEGQKIVGIIHKRDGSTLFCYVNKEREVEFWEDYKKSIEEERENE